MSVVRDNRCGCPVCRAPQRVVDELVRELAKVGRRAPRPKSLLGPALLYAVVYVVALLVLR